MNSLHPPPREVGWLHQAGLRLRERWPLKMWGTIAAMAAFFFVYFWVLRHPQFPVTTMPLTAIDRLVAFQPAALILYLSLWLYVSLVPALLDNRRELAAYVLTAVALSVVGLGIFFFWPTTVPVPDIDWSRHATFAFLKSVDASGNACPSLHVAFAVLSAAWFGHLLRRMGAGRRAHAFNWLWCAGILYSTVAIRQHVALDVLAGAVLGAIAGIVSLRFLRSASPAASPVRAS